MYSSRSSQNIQRMGRKRTNRTWRDKSKLPCTDKEGYPSKDKADKAVSRMIRKNGKKYPGDIRSYRCQKCGLWHIGYPGKSEE